MKFQVTEVEATFTPDGWPIPRHIWWKGKRLYVVDVGRRWRSEDGIHVLARVEDGRVFELHTNGALWWAAVLSDPPRFV